ncbi:autotransporter-associated beta strand repeat-containing protein [Dyella sp.]|uniref:autotransporter-associated beta strand repeat-containing protein n=1 Tax=Dyella sp. TaxID=1869338 RepID=UPI002FDB6647
MNRIFRVIWSSALGTWVVTSELTMRRGKRSSIDARRTRQAPVRTQVRMTSSWLLRLGVMTALLAACAPVQVWAQSNRYWDANGTSPGSGGTGTWDTSSLLWSPNNDGVSGPYAAWNNATFDHAFFNGTAGTVTLGTPINANSLNFGTTGYTLTGGALTFGGATPTISVSSNNTATINSVIAGNAGLTVAGTSAGATLALNATNTFTGGININGATLAFNGDASLGPTSNTITTTGTAGLTNNGTALSASRTVNISSGTLQLTGGSSSADLGAALYTGAGSLIAAQNVNLSNNNNSYTGTTTFNGGGTVTFTSIRDVGGGPSSLGAPTTAANGTIAVNEYIGSLVYTGAGNSSDRNWSLGGAYYSGQTLVNGGTGTLTLSGNIAESYGTPGYPSGVAYIFTAQSADLVLSGVISSSVDTTKNFTENFFRGSGTNRSITLGGANTYSAISQINNVTVNASALANTGSASSFGTGTEPLSGSQTQLSLVTGVVNYTGAAAGATDFTWSVQNSSGINNNSAGGAVTLTGNVGFIAGSTDTLTLGGSYAGVNTAAGVISGSGNLTVNGGPSDVWLLSGANTYIGTNTVNGGTLRAGSAQAFGAASNAMAVNGGTLDLGGYDATLVSLAGTGGSVALGANKLTVSGTTSTSYAGSITGSGSLTKGGTGTLTLSGASTYTGNTVVNGGTLALNFAATGAPASNILSSSSALTMSGGALRITGAAGQSNSQTFNGMAAAAGTNTISVTSGAGGSATLNLGAISSTGGLVNFVLPSSGSITTTNADGALGWATVNGTDYAQVSSGVINGFTNYANKDNAATWLSGDVVSDAGGAANSPYFGTVAGSVQLSGMKYTVAVGSTVTVGAGNTLGVNGTIIVASTVGANNDTITGGNLTGFSGGGTLGILQNSTGTFTVASTIVDSGGGAIGFTKAGTGQVTLSGSNTYTGVTTLSGGQLNVSTIGSGGTASGIGASSNAPSNLVIQNGTLNYTGATATTDRGFTLVNGGPSRTINVANAAANLTFTGQVTSPDNSDFTKTGAGTLTLANAANNYVGATNIAGGELGVTTLANGGLASGIGASSNASSNLVLSGGGALQYTGATSSTDRGFTLSSGNGGFDIANAATDLNVSGTAIGPGQLVKSGAGTLTLSGTNTFTGGITVNAGVLQAGSTSAFGNTTSTNSATIATGATLDLNNYNNSLYSLIGGGNVALGSATLTLFGYYGQTFTGTISGTGGLTTSGGGGAHVMQGCNNSYTGITTLNGAGISTDCLANGGSPSGIGASSNASSNLVFNGGTLTYTGATVSTDRGFSDTAGAGINVSNAATTLTFSGIASGAGGLTKTGAGTLVLSGTNSLTGGTNVSAGTLRTGSANALPTSGMSVQAGATLDLNGFNNTVTGLGGNGNVTLGTGTLTINGFYAGTFDGVISGSGGVTRTGGGYPQQMNGCLNTYTGVTNINGSTLSVQCLANSGQASGIGAATAASGNLLLGNNGSLQYLGTGGSAGTTDHLFSLGTGGGTLDSSGTGAVSFTNTGAIGFTAANSSQTLTLTGTDADNNSLSAQLTDNGTGKTSLSKTGTGTWILQNPGSTYTGITNINGGTLGVGKLSDAGLPSSIGSSTNSPANLVIGNSSVLLYTGSGDSTNRLFSLSGSTSTIASSGTGPVNFTNTAGVTLVGAGPRTLSLDGTNTGTNTLGGTIGDANATTGQTTLAKNGVGDWVLTGNNTYTGNTVINQGRLWIGNGGTTGSVASNNIIIVGGTLAVNRSDTVTLNSLISGAGGVQQAGTGTTVLTNTNTYSGGTSITAGTLQVASDAYLGAASGGITINGGALRNSAAFSTARTITLGASGGTFDAAANLTVTSAIGGTGGLTKINTGTVTLTGTNTYSGTTTVQAGTLLVDGNESAATGATTVQGGGTLGGTGTVGGDVTIASGGALDPGDTAAVGTLAINSNLAVNSGGALNYQFGQANTPGGALNDLTTVSGNLTLGGTLNVSTSPGGSFNPGVYRIINYAGTLTNNGLSVGSTPAGTYYVQTSVNHQVNLVNSTGLTLNFWDGAVGPKNNSAVDGGNGVWQNASGNDNWADSTGVVNAPYANAAFAVFEAAPGTVTVDDSLGNVTSSGMQFAVNGYTITGGAITLAGAPNIIRVGDGTAAGASMTATIDAALVGTGGLQKTDLGTLVLGGANTYAGGTAINGGILQVSSDGNLGDAAGALTLDDGTLRNTAAFTSPRAVTLGANGGTFDTQANLTLDGVIGGSGALTKTSAGTLTLTATNTYAGGTAINGGAVSVASDANLGDAAGALSLNGGTLQNTATLASARTVTLNAGGGTFQTIGDLTLSGAIGGAGALAKTGTAALILTTNDTYAGGTTIAAGTLQLGNGGTTGAITGNVVDNGTLVFNRSDASSFAGVISGTGFVTQQGAGTTVLTGNNRYAGATDINAGSLIVNGDQTAATGLATAASGATLGGDGIIGGDVAIADGATLNPGDVGTVPGMLSIKGNLALGNASTLNYNFGQANVVGGAYNDLTTVSGNLTLGGTINVTTTSGGSFDPGIYRVIDYGGTLTNNGLAVGTMPSPDFFVQTSVNHQVNLVNTAGLPVNVWDGPGHQNDNVIEGGTGLWQNNTGNDNWTLVDGSVNAPYQDASFAIFTAAPGVVTVDNSLGSVRSAGMQFAVDGYTIQGDPITLVGAPNIIRVGDGTSDGANMTATIAAVLTGTGGVQKADLGTLVLAGADTYAGGTTITAGTLQLGNGGASGSITGDVVDNGMLAFNRSDTNTFGGVISGRGAVVQAGSGITMLNGTNTYTGSTTVQAGTLLVNGDQSAATGLATVQGGATLGGTGTLGGDVTLASGATLSPGNIGAAGTLTINGNLQLNSGATLDYQFGQAGTAGGALNDLTAVHGNLTLAGTLNVSTTPGGSFGPGVYRVFNYDGTLTDNGLVLGTLPAANLYVQTSIAHQVNLVDNTGLALNFWDGPAGQDNHVINGGNGTWRLTDNDDWTEASGAVNAPYSNGAFAVFAGTPGTVAIDNGNGQVQASGLQFEVDGYHLTGGTLVLAGSTPTVRVGDGTAAGASMTATIDAQLAGTGTLVKDDLGTLVLTGNNSYAGGTTVQAGTLQVSSDANLGNSAGALTLGDGTLHTIATFQTKRAVSLTGNGTFQADDGTTLTLGRAVTGSGSLAKTGSGTLVLGAASTYSGATTVTAGTLQAAVANAFSASSAVTVAATGTLDLAGFAQNVASLTHAGTVHFGSAPGTTLTVQGDYLGQGGTLDFNTVLGGDNSVTDQLIVNGNTSGSSVVHVTNVGGTGAPTTQGIKLIDVQGASNGSFTLAGNYVFQGQQAVVAGAYAYRLYQGGTSTPNDGDWYLRSALINPSSSTGGGGDPTPPPPLYQPGVPLYEAYGAMLRQINTLDSLYERVGDRTWAGNTPATDAMTPGNGAWVRVQGADQTYKPEISSSGADYDISTWKAQAGVDAKFNDAAGGVLVGGMALQVGRYQTNVDSIYGMGRIKTSSYGIGTTLTWYGDGGFYVDGQWRWTRFDSDLYSTTAAQVLKSGNHGSGYAIGVEVGQRFRLGDAWSLIPQAQVSYGRAAFNAFNDPYGAYVSVQQGRDLVGRAGMAVDYRSAWQGPRGTIDSHLYVIANLYRDAEGATRVDVSGTDLASRNERLWGGLGVGGSLDWGGGTYSVYGEVQGKTGLSHFGDSHEVTGTLGFRMKW